MTTKSKSIIPQATEVITNKEQLNLPLTHINSGKVRETFIVPKRGSYAFLIVTTDRWSAFDFKMPQGIPLKGRILNSMSNLTFSLTSDIVPNHIITTDMSSAFEGSDKFLDKLSGRSVLVKRAEPILFECIVRGFLYGTAFAEYTAKDSGGKVCGIQLKPGLVKASKLDTPIFTPSTKSITGHDENVSFESMEKTLGSVLARDLRDKSLAVYNRLAAYSFKKGLILADTKFEFGFVDGKLTLIDEAVTPDSSRLWNVADYKEGKDQASSNDKQFLRDWLLNEGGWTKEKQAKHIAPPLLPPEILSAAAERYVSAYSIFTGYPPEVVRKVMGSKIMHDEDLQQKLVGTLRK